MTDERDAHLREALRHAPDAQVQPPAALSAFILNEAHAKARDASTLVQPARRSPLATLWDWLARPSVATGFAGVMAATLVGMMWWGQPMDEAAMPRPPAPAAAPTTPTTTPPTAPAATPPVVAQAPAAIEAERTAPPAPRAAPRKPAPEADKASKKEAITAAPQAETAVPAESRAETAQAARDAVAPAAPAPAPAMAPPPPVAAATDSAATAGALAKSKPADEPKRLRSMAGVPANLNELRQQRAEAAAETTLASLRAAIAAEPTRWAWQRDSSPPQAMNDAVRHWLARLDADAGDRWQPLDATALRRGREIRLLHDGRMVHGFRLIESGVLWQRPQGHGQQVTLPPTSLSALETNAP